MVVQDTTMFSINDKNLVVGTTRTFLIPEFTAFHLALTGQLSDYGLKPKTTRSRYIKLVKWKKPPTES